MSALAARHAGDRVRRLGLCATSVGAVMPLIDTRKLARRISDARVHVVRGGGHLFRLDEPDQAIPPIQAFLDAD
jgi:hypothetical protein